jgi:hypothetical protein
MPIRAPPLDLGVDSLVLVVKQHASTMRCHLVRLANTCMFVDLDTHIGKYCHDLTTKPRWFILVLPNNRFEAGRDGWPVGPDDRRGSYALDDDWLLPGVEISLTAFRQRIRREDGLIATLNGRSMNREFKGRYLSEAVVKLDYSRTACQPRPPFTPHRYTQTRLDVQIAPSLVQRIEGVSNR